LLSERQLKRTIADLRAIEKESFGKRQRFRFYVYLSAVLDFYARLRRNNKAKISADRVAELFGIRKRKGTHSIRVLIDATSSADEKTKSRWTRALRYAWREREHWKKLPEFMLLNGGPAGAAAKWSALRSRTPPDSVRIGGKNRVPKIPMFANVELLKPGEMFVKGARVFRQPDVTQTPASSALFKRTGRP
jgi:hypothetical protein